MRLTKNLRAAIVKQFKHGASTEYLAQLYGVSETRVEQIIRLRLVDDEIRVGAQFIAPSGEVRK